MPEFNKRVSFRGIKKAEADFGAYVKRRLGAEKTTDRLLADARDLARKARSARVELEKGLTSRG